MRTRQESSLTIMLTYSHTFIRTSIVLEPFDPNLLLLYGQPNASGIDDPSLESPLYCRRGDFTGFESRQICPKDTMLLLRSVRALIDVTLSIDNGLGVGHEEQVLQHDMVKEKLAELTLITNPKVIVSGDSIYEACRLTAVLVLSAMERQKPFRSLDGMNTTWDALQRAMQHTDVGNNWGPMVSVLLWVSLVAASAHENNPHFRFFDSVARRITVHITYHSDVGSVAVATQRFRRIQIILERAAGNEMDNVAAIS